MRILLDIHRSSLVQEKTLQRLLEHQFKQDPKTYYFLFPPVVDFYIECLKLHLNDLAKKFPEHRDRFIYVKHEVKPTVLATSRFSPYKKDFLKIVRSLVKKCGANERVSVISFGRFRDMCYADIAPEATKAIVEAFKGREIREYHYRPLIYPKPTKPIPSVRIPANRRKRK